MPTAKRLLEAKGTDVASLGQEATVPDAVELMNDRHIGSVVVMEDERIVGIFTERDVMIRVVAARRDPTATRLSEVMTTPVACAAPRTTLNELRQVVREKRIRHVPVVEGGRLAGLISIGDLNRAEHDVQEQTIEYMAQYIFGG